MSYGDELGLDVKLGRERLVPRRYAQGAPRQENTPVARVVL
jgi:hypothetical protein